MPNLFNMFGPHLVERTFYSLDDLVEESQRSYSAAKENNFTFAQFLGNNFDLDTPELNTLLRDYIWVAYHDEFIFFIDGEAPADLKASPEAQKALQNILKWLKDSTPAYIKELEIYQSIENDLLAQLGSSTTTKFNDTPQIAGDVSSDPYITNLTTTESKTDSGTPLERLKEVRNSIRNVYEAWSKEFGKFVIYN